MSTTTIHSIFAAEAPPNHAPSERQRETSNVHVQVAMAVLVIGAIVTVSSVALSALGSPLGAWLEMSTSLEPRLLRLARVASCALPLIAFLAARSLANGTLGDEESALALPRWIPRSVALWMSARRLEQAASLARKALVVGVIAMPLVLVAAAVIDIRLKYLLTIPAVSITFAVVVVAIRTWAQGDRSEALMWATMASSLSFGLVLGMFAFDGPVPVPAFMDEYMDHVRVWSRSLHTLSICVALARISWLRLRS